ncbi:MAG: UMP kinase [Methanomassiliicoccales archaeon]|jgi:uridylate kinase|nr:UMP kinase [Methanomassiliicoccales archaeon]
MERVVVSMGGSVLVPGDNDAVFITKFLDLIKELSKDYRLCIVCGGGKIARYYITTGKEMGLRKDELDELGIMVTRLNARLLQLVLHDVAAPRIPETIEEAARLMSNYNVVIMGGTVPGHTTDAVSALVAKEVSANRIVNATSVDAAYSADPKKVASAKRYAKLSFEELLILVDKGGHEAGSSDVFDKLGAQIAMEARIPIYIVNGRNLEELENAVRGRLIKGTIVSD